MIRYSIRPLLIAGAFVAATATTPAAAQDMGPLLDRLDRLERDIRTLNVRISNGEIPLASSGAGAGAPSGGIPEAAGARLSARLDTLEQDLRASTGNQETVNYQLRQLTERLDKLVGDIDYRLGVIEGRLGIGAPPTVSGIGAPPPSAPGAPATPTASIAPVPGAVSPGTGAPAGTLGTVSARAVEDLQKARDSGQVVAAQPAPGAGIARTAPVAPRTPSAPGAPAIQAAPAAPPVQAAPVTQAAPVAQAAPAPPPAVLPAGTPKEQYTYAFNLLRQTNYDQAEIALKAFIEAHGGNPLASNARYWLGETFYVRADYQQAAQVFFEGFQADSKGAKAPDMLLKLGMSLAQLGKREEACATFDKVAADFAKSSGRIKSALSRERQRASCP